MVSTGVNFNPKYFCTSSRSVCRSCSPAPTDEESDIWTGLPSVRRKFKTVSDLLGVETEAPSFRQFSATFQISRVSNAALKTPSFFSKTSASILPKSVLLSADNPPPCSIPKIQNRCAPNNELRREKASHKKKNASKTNHLTFAPSAPNHGRREQPT